MGKVRSATYDAGKTILKHFPYLGAACLVTESMGSADSNGLKIVKAGTPFPSNDEKCLGYLLEDVDVTYGDAPGTYVYEGTIDDAKVKANSITVTAEAKAATPRVTFFEEPYKSANQV